MDDDSQAPLASQQTGHASTMLSESDSDTSVDSLRHTRYSVTLRARARANAAARMARAHAMMRRDSHDPLMDPNARFHLLRKSGGGGGKGSPLADILCFDQWDLKLATTLLRADEGFWVDVDRPTIEDMRILMRHMGVREATASAILSNTLSERCELHPTYLLVCMRLTVGLSEEEERGFVSLLIFDKAVISLHAEPVEELRTLMQKVHRGNSWLTSERILYLILLENLRQWAPVVNGMEDEVESLHDLALQLGTLDKNDVVLRITSANSRLSLIQRRLLGKRDIVRTISANAFQLLSGQRTLVMRETADHLAELLRTVGLTRDSLNQLQSNYLAKISLDVAESDNESVRSMHVFAIIATVGLPTTALSGVGGMNLWYPHNVGDTNSPAGFIIFLTIMALVGIFLFMLFRFLRLL